ncbi:hypothetical protein M0R45_018237 [Rubus argutus]|uniref:Uncharacterized protein n=1 Tax=Rubus argutus TaxID=59490 RepID=A0AAW1X1V2_RUBAR
MSKATTLHAKLWSIELLIDVPSSSILAINNRKWHSAFLAIYCSRAFLSLRPKTYQCHLHPSHTLLLHYIGHRHEAFGSNTYKKPPTQGFLHFVWEAFKDLTILILLGCAALSLGFGIKEHGLKEDRVDSFNKLSKVSNNLQIEAVRNGRRQQISIFEIVVGDVICLKIGDQVPADGLLLEGHSLSVDESSMTGESDHVEITVTENPFLFSGTKIADGLWSDACHISRDEHNWGEMMSQISQDTSEKTPLQERNTEDENGNKEFNGSKTKSDDIINAVIGIVAAAVTIVVVAIPEGLPLAVTLTLAYSMKRMMVDNAMVTQALCL